MSHGKRFFAFIFCFFAVVFCPLFSVFCEIKIHFIDVGEGDAALIQTSNKKNILIDAGNFISGFKVREYLRENSISTLEYLIFTHPHFDHIGGAFFILPEIRVESVCDNSEILTVRGEAGDIYRWYEELVRKHSHYKILAAGDAFVIDGVHFQVLWPDQSFDVSDFNSNSLVLMLKYNNFRCLFTGDLTCPAENNLLDYLEGIEIDILKVAHHGAGDASSQAFIEEVSAKSAVISVDKDNSRGYPASEVLARLQELNFEVYRTDRDGDIIVSVDEEGEFVLECKNDYRRIKNNAQK